MSYNPDNRTALNAPKILSGYSEKIQITLTFPENSPHTRQEFKDESDINTIMARYLRSGELPQLNLTSPQYLDLDGSTFQEQMEYVAGAQSLFNELPSYIRNRFQNDPGQFIDFCSNENNRPELARMGLLSTNATREALTPRVAPNVPTNASQAPTPAPPEMPNQAPTQIAPPTPTA